MTKAIVKHGLNNVTELESSSIGGIFKQCQYYLGHCLGKITDQNGNRTGWRFARCGTKDTCIPEIYEVHLEV